MIDKNGKLFGKINIIDLLILLIVAAALVFFAVRLIGPGSGDGDAQSTPAPLSKTPVRITFFADDAPIVLKDRMEEQLGSSVRDWDSGKNKLGTFVSYEATDNFSYIWDETSGKLVEIPDYSTFHLSVTSEVEGTLTEKGLNINGYQYYIGASYTICVGQTRIFCRISDFESLDENYVVEAANE